MPVGLLIRDHTRIYIYKLEHHDVYIGRHLKTICVYIRDIHKWVTVDIDFVEFLYAEMNGSIQCESCHASYSSHGCLLMSFLKMGVKGSVTWEMVVLSTCIFNNVNDIASITQVRSDCTNYKYSNGNKHQWPASQRIYQFRIQTLQKYTVFLHEKQWWGQVTAALPEQV